MIVNSLFFLIWCRVIGTVLDDAGAAAFGLKYIYNSYWLYRGGKNYAKRWEKKQSDGRRLCADGDGRHVEHLRQNVKTIMRRRVRAWAEIPRARTTGTWFRRDRTHRRSDVRRRLLSFTHVGRRSRTHVVSRVRRGARIFRDFSNAKSSPENPSIWMDHRGPRFKRKIKHVLIANGFERVQADNAN